LKVYIPFLLAAFFVSSTVDAQQKNTEATAPSISIIADSLAHEKDMADVVNRILKKTTRKNTDPDAPHISVLPAAGYSLQTGWAAILSSNIAFHIHKNPSKEEKTSSILASITYSQYKQIILPVQANIWTKNNTYNIITDCRYLKYPSTTYGLGPQSKITNGYNIDYSYIKLHQTLLRSIHKNLYAGAGIYYDHFWNVKEVDPPAGIKTSFEKYGLAQQFTASGLALKLLYDSRLNQVNPTNGWYANMVYRPNFTFMGSDNNWQSAVFEVRKYIHVPASSKNVLALWNYNWFTLAGKPPFLLLPSTGWDDFYNTGRGYIQGRYRSKNMVYVESEYRFPLSSNGLFGAVVFANAQSFSRQLSNELSVIAPGYGVGLRIKINKFSGANVCIDYGFGNDNSRGIAINLGEVF
jgi:outer membrane protein assembly factor BamA